jgi:hypothetical protein
MRRGLLASLLALGCSADRPGDPARTRPAPEDRNSAPAEPAHASKPVPKDTTPAAPAEPETAPPIAATPPSPAPLAPVPSDSPSPAARTPPSAPLELAFVGDIILGKYVLNGYASLVDDAGDPFSRVRPLVDADLLVGNLETPLVRRRPTRSPIHIGYRFGADADAARALVRAGLGALSLANNHANDLLGDGLRDTPEILRELGIAAVGAARVTGDPVAVVTVERAGWRIGLVSATTYVNRGAAAADPALPLYRTRELPARMLPHLAAARRDHDLLIVLVHWGQEFAEAPDSFQRVTARRLLDGGADLVIGHHPHVLQGLERHEHGLVAYSLGNFLFANFDERSRHSGVLRVRYQPGRRCPSAASFHPVFLGPPPTYAPEPAGSAADEILAQVRKASRRLRTPWTADSGRLVLTDFPACDGP